MTKIIVSGTKFLAKKANDWCSYNAYKVQLSSEIYPMCCNYNSIVTLDLEEKQYPQWLINHTLKLNNQIWDSGHSNKSKVFIHPKVPFLKMVEALIGIKIFDYQEYDESDKNRVQTSVR